jgi:hypothetical protein
MSIPHSCWINDPSSEKHISSFMDKFIMIINFLIFFYIVLKFSCFLHDGPINVELPMFVNLSLCNKFGDKISI